MPPRRGSKTSALWVYQDFNNKRIVELYSIKVHAKKDDTQQSVLGASLGLFDATAVSVGAIIGGGIFVVTGIAAGLAGSAMIVSVLVAAVISMLTASSFAELTAWQPREGSIYEYTYQLISPFAGFLTGWMWILSNTLAGTAVSLGFAYYLGVFWPTLPANYVAAVICLLFTIINYYGVQESAKLNNVLVVAKLLILTVFVILGLSHINTANFQPFKPLDAGVFYGAGFFFFAYGGFARAAVIAEEVKDAKRNVPRAMMLALGISAVFYLLVGTVAIGLVGPERLAGSHSPLEEAMKATGNSAATTMISVGGMLATASVLLTSVLGVSRMAYAMARRKDLPQQLSKLHPTRNTPVYATWIIGILMALLALFADLSEVVAVGSFGLLLFYTLANVSALRLETQKRVHQKILPGFGAITCTAMLAFLLFASPRSWTIGVACLIIGALYYVAKQKLTKASK
jgi:APA family basic amino acid/polyamine antiporter